ncbi:MAG: hypothetical protein GX422_02735 [Deltaproteobacteria bacterium]|jgi:hypothetical protein|nr:hypothetical protein [Deltaproteobacteria bacterium]
MSDWTFDQTAERNRKTPFDAAAFANHIQEQANHMDKCGWSSEARDLRKWASELRDKSTSVNNHFGDRTSLY